MHTGDIVLISFPFTDLVTSKVRPAVIIAETPDYDDIIVCLITSVIPIILNPLGMVLQPDKINNLKTISLIKVYRNATVKSDKVLSRIGKLNTFRNSDFRQKFKSLVDND